MAPRATPNPVITQIRALSDGNTKLQNDFEAYKVESDKKHKILFEKIKWLTLCNKDLQARINDLEDVCYEKEGPEQTNRAELTSPGASGDEGETNAAVELSPELRSVERSAEAADSNVVKVSTKSCF